MVTAHSARYVSYLEKQRLKIKQVTFLLRDALIFITLNCFCHFNRKPAPHPDLHFHGCCSTGCIVFDFSLLEIGLMSLLYLTPLAWVCFPVGKCMPTCLSAVGKSCLLLEVILCLLLRLILNSVTNKAAVQRFVPDISKR